MKIIKLDAIDSTNSFLKELGKNSVLENFTVAVTSNQTNGRGQQQNTWASKPFKNLTFSVFTRFKNLGIHQKKHLNFAISLGIFDAISTENLPKLSIKWPNDILSENKKLCGILIENSIKGSKINSSVIGIGLNVNQIEFPDHIKSVSSLKKETEKEYDLDPLLSKIISKIKERITLLNDKQFQHLENDYLNVLYKKNIPTMFKDSNNVLFMGMISGVSKEGRLQITLEDDLIKEFDIKEVAIL
ncbi:MAG: biotin--[acetyl-CoA-carboxylase] ligase [Polaribacter sp.]|uniref:biotin--[acetyl-CoA-carboxylase] ligase n=1 Tax=Polaribacter sp. TaxID=1920175 RepID=UPI002F351159